MTGSGFDVRTDRISAGDWSAWQQAREEIEKAVAEAKEIAERVEAKADFTALDKATRALQDHAFRIGVIGNFSTGKSTLINAMIGAEMLLTGVLPLTARLAEIRYGPSDRITLLTENGVEEVSQEEFNERNKKLKAAEEAGKPVDPAIDYLKAIIELDRPLLRSGLVFVDVPGHNSGFSSHEAIADDAMRSCDALIAVLLADAALGKVESDRLETALLDLEHQSVFIAVNKLDTLRPEQQTELIAEFPKRWARFLDSLDLPSEIKEPLRDRVYFIDSFNTLQRKLGRSAPDTGVKEFARLERDLAAMADGDLIAEKLDRPRRVLLRQLADLQRTIKDQYRLLDADAEKLLAHRQTIDGSIDKLERIASEIRRTCEEAGILRACRQSVRHAAEIRFTNYLDRLPAWARVGRADRPRPDGNRFMRLGPHRVRARIKLIAAELLNRFQKELLRFTEELASRGDGNDGASRPIWQALQDTYDLAEPALYEFEREIARMWQEVLSDPNARPPVADLRGAIQDLLKDFTGIPLEIQPVGVTTLIMRNVTERIQEIFLRLADPGGSSDASDLLKAVWELQQEITAGLQQLASVLVGTDAEVRNALDELLEKYACRAVAAALTDGTGNVATLAERYAANAERVVKNRQDALLGFLHDQTNRVRSLYDNTVRTVEAGLEEVRAKKAVLLEDSTRLTTLWSAFEEAR